MKKTIWKYVLIPGRFDISIPVGATILTVREQKQEICLWAEVNPNAPLEIRNFETFGTGHDMHIDMGVARKYIGTASLHGGDLMFHIYERLNQGGIP